MAAALGWRQPHDRVRFQPVLYDGRGLYRVRTRAGIFFRPVWRRRLSLVEIEVGDEAEPITFRSRHRALRIATVWEDTHRPADGWTVADDGTDRRPL